MAGAFERVFVLGIDGVPHSLLERFSAEGVMPNLTELQTCGQSVQIDSVYPTVSNVAWACFQTGKGPGKFDIFGFTEVDEQMRLRIPNTTHLRSKTIQQLASDAGRRVISLGLPSSYPPRPVNGLMVSGFLAPTLERAVHPPDRLEQLTQLGYQLDIDPVRASGDLPYLKSTVLKLLDGRRRTTEALMSQPWDLFLLHVMETDRVNHFMWGLWDSGDCEGKAFFEDFYRRVDDFVGELADRLGPKDLLLILSDHGFCLIRHEVELNRWLMDEGYLKLSGDPTKEMFAAISGDSAAFAMVPGRIYLLDRDKYGRGSVTDANRQNITDEIIAKLQSLQDPGTCRAVCKSVFRRAELFAGPYANHAPDIVIDPNDGYDLKGSLTGGEIFSASPITGMHTYYDAYLYARGAELAGGRRCITDVTRSIAEALSIPVPPDMDSRGVLL